LPDGFIAYYYAAGSKQFLNLAVAQRKFMIEPNGVTNDGPGKTVTFIGLIESIHRPSLAAADQLDNADLEALHDLESVVY